MIMFDWLHWLQDLSLNCFANAVKSFNFVVARAVLSVWYNRLSVKQFSWKGDSPIFISVDYLFIKIIYYEFNIRHEVVTFDQIVQVD